MKRQGEIFGGCLLAPEKNNHGHATIARLKQIYNVEMLHQTQGKETKIEGQEQKPKEYGWHTNGLTKSSMIFDFKKAVEDGLIELNDEKLIAETKSYTRNDLMDRDIDPRLTTRHFDIFTAACIAWQLKDFAIVIEKKEEYDIDKYEFEENMFDEIGM
jgi:hypothetical protein